MIFNSADFFFFIPVVVVFLFLLPKKARVWWLLCTSYYFYICWNPEYLFLLVFSTLSTYGTGILLEKNQAVSRKKIILTICCLVNFAIVFVFKYLNFALESVNWLYGKVGIASINYRLDLLLPVGISYYTFQAIGYIVDVYRGGKAEHSFVRYALFVSYFPQLSSGPIERSGNMLKQFESIEKISRLWDYDRVKNGILLFLWGMFQKVVLADRLALYVDTVYNSYQEYGLTELVAATILFAFQIYCDFDGYTNMACGVSEVMGITIMKNFKRPYFATNIKEFWRRWHISLTSWFRDYLYFPLGGNRKGDFRKNINVLIVFCVSGLWHGANWTYVIWGALHGILQVIHNIFSAFCKSKKECFSVKLRNWFVTFVVVDFAWLFFRAQSLQEAVGILRQMTRVLGDFSGVLEVLGDGDRNLLIVGLLILFIVDFVHEKGVSIRQWISGQEMWFRYAFYIGIICACIYLGIQNGADAARQFIYFQF